MYTFNTPYFIGIAGASGAGKSELSKELQVQFPSVAVVSLDSYYLPFEHLPLRERKRLNFDDPTVLDWELITKHLYILASGRGIEQPFYSFESI